jgi:hypothetical protein
MREILVISIFLLSWGNAPAEGATVPPAAPVDIAELRSVLEKTPEDGSAHYQLGTLLMNDNLEPDAAIGHFKRAAELGFQPVGAAYRLSRLYARLGMDAEAFAQLEIVTNGGFGLIDLIDGEADYDDIRDQAAFTALTQRIRANRYPCQGNDDKRAFDFWIGEWTVSQNGQFAGTNSIQPILGHCVLFEQWESASGSLGKSFNYYDPAHDHWRQIWVSDTGTIIEFTGKARDGGIFYTAETINRAEGSVTLHRFEFTQLDNGAVRQFWQTSNDDGETWQIIWDGKYELSHRRN